ncbi:MAG: hypothetical protein IJ139_03770 [Bacteroidaceae bacterium]|nr:hypothetical protein [Bacteroidaceae bacterium]MBQ9175967.1 hypothetical protein [Bacteroidaceae bacterium]
MKTKYLLMAAMMLLGTMCFTACGDDDDDVEKAIEKIDNGTMKPTVTINETATQLVFTATWQGVMVEVYTATFSSDGTLTKYICTTTYATDKLADEAWKELKEDLDPEEEANYSRNGRTITVDLTSEVEGANRQIMNQIFQSLKAEYEKGVK